MRHLAPLISSVALAAGLAVALHEALRGPAAPLVAVTPGAAEVETSPEVRARDALLAYVAARGFHLDRTESAGFIDVFGNGGLLSAFEERRFVFVAREGEAAHRDTYLLRARVAPNGAPLSVGELVNLTRTPDGDEAWLTPRPGQVAYTTRFAGLYTGVTVLDLNGAPPEPGTTLEMLLTQSLTDWLEIGDWRGMHVARYVLAQPAVELRLSWEGDTLLVSRLENAGWSEARLDLTRLSLRREADVPWLRAVETHRAARSFLSWAVDTARAISWIGPERIYALETVFFRLADLVHTARYRLLGESPAPVDAPMDADGSGADAAGASGPALPDPRGPWPIERPPVNLKPRLEPPLPDEGVWRPFHFRPRPPGTPPVFWRTVYRVDAERPDAITELVLADPRQVSLHMVGGTEHPRSTTGEVGTGMVPPEDRERTLAAFNGGFQAIHGSYGMIVDRTVLLPPLPQAATVATWDDARTLFGTWTSAADAPLPPGLVSLRQNLPPLVDRGVFNPLGRRTWGFTMKGSDPIFTWRTGLGLTAAGRFIFAVCVRCSADTLADALIAADTDYAVHLDMNISNIGWEWWRPGAERGEVERASLMRDMWKSDTPRYVDPHPRDFFYLARREVFRPPADAGFAVLPSADGLPVPPGMWPPPVLRGRLTIPGGELQAIRLEWGALGMAPPGEWCELAVHQGLPGEGLPHDAMGEAPRPEPATLTVDEAGRLVLLPPGVPPPPGRFFQQLPAVRVGGKPTGTLLPGPTRWLLGADARGGLWLLGGPVTTPELQAAAGRLGIALAVGPTPNDGVPRLVCAGRPVIDGTAPISARRLPLGRAAAAPAWPTGRGEW